MKKRAPDRDLCLRPFLLTSPIMWLPTVLQWHTLDGSAGGGWAFCRCPWTLAGLTAPLIGCGLLQSSDVSFFLDHSKAWAEASLFPEISAFRYQGKCSGFALVLEAVVTLAGVRFAIRKPHLWARFFKAPGSSGWYGSGCPSVELVTLQLRREKLFYALGLVHLGQSYEIWEFGTAV